MSDEVERADFIVSQAQTELLEELYEKAEKGS